jgi:hypothetical protein
VVTLLSYTTENYHILHKIFNDIITYITFVFLRVYQNKNTKNVRNHTHYNLGLKQYTHIVIKYVVVFFHNITFL